jgi:tRNA A-37 threonylcarbamoyl transferase component Bud32
MGQVYLARDMNLRGRWVALKRLSRELLADRQARERFNVEAETIARLSHHHIVHVFERGEDDAGPFIVMEYVPGPPQSEAANPEGWTERFPNPPLDLFHYVRFNGPMAPERVIEFGIKLSGALKYAHDRGIIHRDVKPANVLLDEDLEPRLVDFGLARETNESNKLLTLPGAQMRSFGFGAPEQERDASTVDHRADIYGLAATIWFCLSGESAEFFRESEVPPGLRPVLIKALKKDPEQRYQHAADLRLALQTSHVSGPVYDAEMETPAGYWRCLDCGQFNRDDKRHCEKCGEGSLHPCPHCGEETRRGVSHCGHCGVNLGAYRSAQECLRNAESAASQKAFATAKHMLGDLGEDSGAHESQITKAAELVCRLDARIAERSRLVSDIRSSILARAWDTSLLEKLRWMLPQRGATEEAGIAAEDKEIPTTFQELESQFRQELRRDLEQARESRDLASWSRLSVIASSVFTHEEWTRGELTDGVTVRRRFCSAVEEIVESLRCRKYGRLAEYQDAKRLLDEAATWTGHEAPADLAAATEAVGHAIERLPALLCKWDRGEWSPAELAELRELLPANAEFESAALNLVEEQKRIAETSEQAHKWADAMAAWEVAGQVSSALQREPEKCRERREEYYRSLAEETRQRWPKRAYWAAAWFSVVFFVTAGISPLLSTTYVVTLTWAVLGFALGVLHARAAAPVLPGRRAWIIGCHALAFGAAALVMMRRETGFTWWDWRVIPKMLMLGGGLAAVGTLIVHAKQWREYLRVWPIVIAWVFLLPLAGYLAETLATEGSRIAVPVVRQMFDRFDPAAHGLLLDSAHSPEGIQHVGQEDLRTALLVARVTVLSVATFLAGIFAGFVFLLPIHGQVSIATHGDQPYQRLISKGVVVFACFVFFVMPRLEDPSSWILGGVALGVGVAVSRLLLRATGGISKPRGWGREIAGAAFSIVWFGAVAGAAVYAARELAVELKLPSDWASYRGAIVLLLIVSAIGLASFLVTGGVNTSRGRAMFALPGAWLILAMISAGVYQFDWKGSGVSYLSPGNSWIPALAASLFAGALIISVRRQKRVRSAAGPVLFNLAALVLAGVVCAGLISEMQ